MKRMLKWCCPTSTGQFLMTTIGIVRSAIDTKTTDGFVVEKIVKSGFGELGYVKQGDAKTQDVYRKEKITVSGGQADCDHGRRRDRPC